MPKEQFTIPRQRKYFSSWPVGITLGHPRDISGLKVALSTPKELVAGFPLRSHFVPLFNKRTSYCHLVPPEKTDVRCNPRMGGCRIVRRQIGGRPFSPVSGADAQPRCVAGDYLEKSEFTSVAA